MTEPESFKEWALLELFGHQRLAGHVTEQQLGGASFVRVDVPEDEDEPRPSKKKKELNWKWKLTRLYNPSAIYSITPVSEATARLAARSIAAEPITRWDVGEMVRQAKRTLRPAAIEDDGIDR